MEITRGIRGVTEPECINIVIEDLDEFAVGWARLSLTTADYITQAMAPAAVG